MRVRGALQTTALLAAALLTTPISAKDAPTFSVKEFENAPRNLNYFDDSDVILFQDISENNIYRSADGGATWKRIDGVPEGKAFSLFMHEYDSKRAYALTP